MAKQKEELEYNLGGDIGTGLSAAAPMMSAIPGWGAIAGMGMSALGGFLQSRQNDAPATYQQTQSNTNPYGYVKGGTIKEVIPGIAQVKADTSAENRDGAPDSVQVNMGGTTIELAGDEVVLLNEKNKGGSLGDKLQGGFVLSNALTIPGTDKTFASAAEAPLNMLKNDENPALARQMLQNLADLNQKELIKSNNSSEYKSGGKLTNPPNNDPEYTIHALAPGQSTKEFARDALERYGVTDAEAVKALEDDLQESNQFEPWQMANRLSRNYRKSQQRIKVPKDMTKYVTMFDYLKDEKYVGGKDLPFWNLDDTRKFYTKNKPLRKPKGARAIMPGMSTSKYHVPANPAKGIPAYGNMDEFPEEALRGHIDKVLGNYKKKFKRHGKSDKLWNTDQVIAGLKALHDDTGYVAPVDLLFAQMRKEGAFNPSDGGRSKYTNPMNVGETDSKTIYKFKTPEAGFYAWGRLLYSDYLSHRTREDLYSKKEAFKNHGDNRYATSPYYEVGGYDEKNRYHIGVKQAVDQYRKMMVEDPEAAKAGKAQKKINTYSLKEGDTPYEIADKLGLDRDAFLELNRLASNKEEAKSTGLIDPSTLPVGYELIYEDDLPKAQVKISPKAQVRMTKAKPEREGSVPSNLKYFMPAGMVLGRKEGGYIGYNNGGPIEHDDPRMGDIMQHVVTALDIEDPASQEDFLNDMASRYANMWNEGQFNNWDTFLDYVSKPKDMATAQGFLNGVPGPPPSRAGLAQALAGLYGNTSAAPVAQTSAAPAPVTTPAATARTTPAATTTPAPTSFNPSTPFNPLVRTAPQITSPALAASRTAAGTAAVNNVGNMNITPSPVATPNKFGRFMENLGGAFKGGGAGTALQIAGALGQGAMALFSNQGEQAAHTVPNRYREQQYNPASQLLANQRSFSGALDMARNSASGFGQLMSRGQQSYANKMAADRTTLDRAQLMNNRYQQQYDRSTHALANQNANRMWKTDQVNKMAKGQRMGNLATAFGQTPINLGQAMNRQAANQEAVRWYMQAIDPALAASIKKQMNVR